MRRARVVLITSTLVLVAVLVAGAAVLAADTGPGRTYTYDVALADLPDGRPVGVAVRLPGLDGPPGRVIFVRNGSSVAALSAVDNRTGCEVLIPGDRDYDGLVYALWSPDPILGDNCGGSRWAIDGTCLGGPCRRDLDHYPVEIRDGRATVDIRARIAGTPTARRSTLPALCTFDNPAAAMVGPPVLADCPG